MQLKSWGGGKTILHIGPPKTGTTTLQEQVFTDLNSICFLGKRWWNPKLPYDKCVAIHRAVDSITKSPLGEFDADFVKSVIADWYNCAPKEMKFYPNGSTKVSLLSEERLAVTDVVDHREIAHRLSLVFPNAEIVYTLRDPIAGMQSGYNWFYGRAWTDQNFSDWLNEGLDNLGSSHTAALMLRSYDWPQVKRSFSDFFPVVRTVCFNDIHCAPERFIECLLGICSEEFKKFSWISERPLNVSVKGQGVEIHRITKKLIRIWNKLQIMEIDEKSEYMGDTKFWKNLENILTILPYSHHLRCANETDINAMRRFFAFHYAENEDGHFCSASSNQSLLSGKIS